MRVLLITIACCAAGAVPAAAASGQARLISSVPEAEAVLQTAPERLVLRFSNRVAFAPDAVRVWGSEGAAIAVDAATGRGRRLEVELPAGLRNGSYALGWRVTDDHGRPASGALNFHVGAPPEQPAVAAPPRVPRTAEDELRDLARTALFVAGATLLGSLLVFLLRRRRRESAYAMTAGQTALACTAVATAGLVVLGEQEAKAPPPAPGTHTAQLRAGGTAELNITPPRVGAPRFTLEVTGPQGQPDFALDRVVARLTLVERKLGPYLVTLPKRQVTRFEPDLLTFPLPGRWRVELSLERGGSDPERLVFEQEISR